MRKGGMRLAVDAEKGICCLNHGYVPNEARRVLFVSR